MKKIITDEFLAQCRKSWSEDRPGHMAANSIMQNGPMLTAMDHEKIRQMPFQFSIDLGEKGITDQGSSLRCWTFGSLNVVRQNAADALDIDQKEFELSQNFTYFYDQLEKSADYLERAERYRDLPMDSEELLDMCRQPIYDNGQWFIFAKLMDRYGVVPKSVMPDSECSMNTRYVTRLLSRKLRIALKEIREAAREEIGALKEKHLRDIYGILCRFLGEPPQKFTYEYRDKKGGFHRLKDITPVEFARRYGGMPAEEYMFIVNHPLAERPFGKTYVTRTDGDLAPGPDVYLNLPIEEIKKLVVNQLKGGEQVVMACDVAKQSYKGTGFMDAGLYDYDALFGTSFGMTKEDAIRYKGITGTHVMTFSGVNLDESGVPDRWKVQNSYGKSMGINGHYVMSDDWFDAFVLSVVIRRRYAADEILKAYDQTPEIIKMSEFY